MKTPKNLIILLLIFFVPLFLLPESEEVIILKGRYLGQHEPGSQVKIFAETIVSTIFDEHSGPIFSRDGKELYWSASFDKKQRGVILFMKIGADNCWSLPESVPFSNNDDLRDLNPCLSFDNQTMYFTSRRPLKNEKTPGDINIWKSLRTQAGWSEPGPVTELLNYGGFDAQVSISQNGTLFFAAQWPGGKGDYDIYMCPQKEGTFSSPRSLSSQINTEHAEFGVFVDPAERYIVFSSNRPGGFGASDIYVSIRQGNSWSKPKNLGKKINTEEEETYSSVSPDGRFFFFIGQRDEEYDIYWTSATILR